MAKDINRLKVVLAEKKTNKWLAEQLGESPRHCFKMVYQRFPTLN